MNSEHKSRERFQFTIHQRPEGAASLFTEVMECLQCGTCCVAPDITALAKPAGIRCPLLGDDCRCTDYHGRPDVCRGYRPDEICGLVAAPTLERRVAKYLALFGLESGAI